MGNALAPQAPGRRHDERPDSRNAPGLQVLLQHQGVAQCRPHRLSRRNPRFDGRERRRQIDAHEDIVGRVQARSGRRDPHRGQAGAHPWPARRSRSRHLHHLPGTLPRPQSERRGEYLSGPRNLTFRVAGARRHASRRRPDARAARRGFRAVDSGGPSVHGPAPTGRDCPCAAREIKDPDHGRADHRAFGR